MSAEQPIAWITGAESGIGAALAQGLSGQSWRVIGSSRRATDYPLDITDAQACKDTIARIEAEVGPIHLAILNAGAYEPGPTLGTDSEALARLMAVNYFGTVNCLNPLLERFRERGGHIAVVASLAGYRGLPNANGYGPSKAALIHHVESLRAEIGEAPVKLQLVNPGFVSTPLTAKNRFDMPYLMTPDQAAAAIIDGLNSNRFEIAFPKPLLRRLSFMRHLPYWAYFKILDKMGIR